MFKISRQEHRIIIVAKLYPIINGSNWITNPIIPTISKLMRIERMNFSDEYQVSDFGNKFKIPYPGKNIDNGSSKIPNIKLEKGMFCQLITIASCGSTKKADIMQIIQKTSINTSPL